MTATGLYGVYGGRYVPETLVPALDELEQGWRAVQDDPSFHAELEALSRDVRRPPHARSTRPSGSPRASGSSSSART